MNINEKNQDLVQKRPKLRASRMNVESPAARKNVLDMTVAKYYSSTSRI